MGLLAIAQLSTRWQVKSWLTRAWRTEGRAFRSGGGSNADYADHQWNGQVAAIYGSTRGFGGEMAFEFLDVVVLRGELEVPAQAARLATYASRVRINARWRFSPDNFLMFGYRFHLFDRWTVGRIFDGIQARFTLHW